MKLEAVSLNLEDARRELTKDRALSADELQKHRKEHLAEEGVLRQETVRGPSLCIICSDIASD